MKIVVLVKQVPDVQSERRIEAARLVRGEDDVLNEVDENAVEAAVSLVEEFGGEVIAVTMGPDDAVDAVRRALQMGADRGVQICDDALAGADALATATVLAAVVRHLGAASSVDLVLTGMSSTDGDTGVLPAAVAARLGWPVLSVAAELRVTAESVEIVRTVDRMMEVLQTALPAVVSVTDQVNDPRIPAFKAMMAARKKPIEVLELAELFAADATCGTAVDADITPDTAVSSGSEVISAAPKPAREAGRIIVDTGNAGTELAAYLTEVMK